MKILILLISLVLMSGCSKFSGTIETVLNEKKETPEDIPVVAKNIEDKKDATVDELKEELHQLKKKSPEETSLKKEVKNVYIFMGTFKTFYFYESMIKKTAEEGLSSVSGSVMRGSEKYRTVKVGPYTKKEAVEKMSELKEKGFPKDMFLSYQK